MTAHHILTQTYLTPGDKVLAPISIELQHGRGHKPR